MFGWAGGAGVLGANTDCFSLSYDDPEAVSGDALRSDACVSVDRTFDSVPPKIQFATLPAGRYAEYEHRGAFIGISAAYQNIFGEWLPNSGESIREAPCIEIYLNDPDSTPEQDLRTLLCVPLRDNAPPDA